MDLKKELVDCIDNGLVVRINFPKLTLENFSKIILMLTNIKSNKLEGLVDFRTYSESNIIDTYFKLDDETTNESVIDFVNRICKMNTLKEEYTIEIIEEIKVITITNWLLEENKIIKEDEEFVVIKN